MKFIAAAVPANDDLPTLRLAPQHRVDQLLAELDASKTAGRTFERPSPPQRIRLHPAPWLRRQIAIEDRIGA